jgi:2-keto-4-pentenoate hydratase/2-oxohepta-3-ene-1,7-dioic acid hydratase in catechol pathway
VAYIKPRAAVIGPEDEIEYSALTSQLDYEVELVAVVGRDIGRTDERPTGALLGYTIGNDVSARDAMSPIGGPDLFSMKGLRRSTPLGPWIVTKDELDGAGQVYLEISLRVNGERRQHDRTSNMLWTVDELLHYVLARTDMTTGDVLFTGTTGGTGYSDGRYLQPGDVVECEVERIGVLRNIVGPRQSDGRP